MRERRSWARELAKPSLHVFATAFSLDTWISHRV